MYPNASLIKGNGEVNAWDNPDFKAAVEATGRKQIILGGIVTEVCTMFLALALREAGYSVWANTDASGTATRSSLKMPTEEWKVLEFIWWGVSVSCIECHL
ncbi:hypothetical protein LTS15_009682 [Exophiala xenobiotica]|nr:hypothetical protein LTS15_009682 [Exophiala xenobiotica]